MEKLASTISGGGLAVGAGRVRLAGRGDPDPQAAPSDCHRQHGVSVREHKAAAAPLTWSAPSRPKCEGPASAVE